MTSRLPFFTDEQKPRPISLLTQHAKDLMTASIILERVAKRTAYTSDEIRGKRRTANLAFARHIAMAKIREATTLSLEEIGNIFSRGHGTALYAVRRIRDELTTHQACTKDFAEQWNALWDEKEK